MIIFNAWVLEDMFKVQHCALLDSSYAQTLFTSLLTTTYNSKASKKVEVEQALTPKPLGALHKIWHVIVCN